MHTPESRQELARLCLGQRPASTAAELVVCVARWDTWRETTAELDAWLASRIQLMPSIPMEGMSCSCPIDEAERT